MEEKGLTVADAIALRDSNGTNNMNDGFGNNGAWWIIVFVLFFAFGGWGRGGYGNNGGGNCDGGCGTNTVVIPANGFGGFGGYNACCSPATQQGLTDAFNFNQLDNGQRGIERGICDGFYTTNLAITNLGTQMQQGFCATDRANLQGFNGIQSALCQGFNSVNNALAQTNYNMKDCCCETRESIMQSNFNNQSGFNAIQNQLASCCCDIERGQDGFNYNLAKSTCEIITNQDKNTDRIINYLTQHEMDSLRTELQSAQLQLSQLSQTRSIIDQLQPCPKPAYLTCSPYTTYPVNFNSNCNTCC